MNLSNRVYWLGLCVELAVEKGRLPLDEAKKTSQVGFCLLAMDEGCGLLADSYA